MHNLDSKIRQVLKSGTVITAHPLALTAERKLNERRQRALSRYYIAAGAGGLAVGVHTTQFAIREPRVGLFDPVLHLAAEEMDRADRTRDVPLVRVGGICGQTSQALAEARLLRDLKYHVGLLSLASVKNLEDEQLIGHCREVAEILPIMGFYLQAAVGGRVLSYNFWRRFVEIENVVAIKIAPFNRYQTLDVVRAVAESGREVALYTGNDDNIVMDLLTPYGFQTNGNLKEFRIVGGLLGHWAVWTRRAVELLADCHRLACAHHPVPQSMLRKSIQVTDCNAAFFDTAHQFAGCIAGLHEVLRRQGLLEGIWCLDPQETLSPGQKEEIDRVYLAYPELNDDQFVRQGRDTWLKP
ncbi:MAG TPA: dihydrodipicolinate synthase family protein [Candidatus Bathyarchaeia archaeon]|jgi:dihydrodipicolinate synthase/N-acetylneuraminate lyase|nr:dihydrodipicolinate synthase family protein [Candidatus Bathyarchaeia archaeon]